MSDATEPVPTDAQMRRLVDAHAAYKAAVPEIYDEVLHEVAERVAGSHRRSLRS